MASFRLLMILSLSFFKPIMLRIAEMFPPTERLRHLLSAVLRCCSGEVWTSD